MASFTLREKFWGKWIMANNFGTYSISTDSLTNTSRWDSLFSILLDKRYNLLGKLWDVLYVNNREYQLDTNDFGNVIHPEGYKLISQIRKNDSFEIYYNIGTSILKKSIKLSKNQNNLVVKYEFIGNDEADLKVIPLMQMREAQELNLETKGEIGVSISEDIIYFRRKNLEIRSNRPQNFVPDAVSYYNFHYVEDEERGYDSKENLYSPGYFLFKDIHNIELEFWAGSGISIGDRPSELGGKPRLIPKHIWDGADLFVNNNNIIAGFPWFDYWSRDTFISLPGLVLVRGLFQTAKEILINWMRRYPEGKIPSKWNGDLYPSDSPLWFIYSVKKYMDYTNDSPFLYTVIEYIRKILDNYIAGYEGIKLDGYFVYSPPGRTWMDGNCDGKFITPREGKPIEVNALWYNSLKIFQEFLIKINQKMPEEYANLMAGFEEHFTNTFVRGNRIKDVVGEDDFSIRPNFLIASYLPYEYLGNLKPFIWMAEKLLTPYGLRTLSPEFPQFKGIYMGNQCDRDAAYHNGSVWPWLIGPYITSMVRNGSKPGDLAAYFSPVLNMQYIPEIFDGYLPGIPRGSYAQAWSYGEIIRAFKEDLKV